MKYDLNTRRGKEFISIWIIQKKLFKFNETFFPHSWDNKLDLKKKKKKKKKKKINKNFFFEVL
jgi:hypothetical protein